jgi:hypothetical protein
VTRPRVAHVEGIGMNDHATLDLSALVLKHVPLDDYTRDMTVSQILTRTPHGIAVLITHHPAYYSVERKTLGQLAVSMPN